jgi:hypothetical protein
MAFPTKPAFHYIGTWSAEMLAHPAMKWQHDFTKDVFDSRNWDVPATKYLTSDFVLQKADGVEVHGAEAGWEADKALYAPFTSHKHEPRGLICVPTDGGWEMIGRAYLYVNLPGEGGATKVKDLEGTEWDAACVGMFRFLYRKDAEGVDGIKLSRVEICSDPLPALSVLVKRGVVGAEQVIQ